MTGSDFIAGPKPINMGNQKKSELTQKLEDGILAILQEYHPTLSKKLKKDVKSAGKSISKRMEEVQEALEKKARKAVKKHARAAEKAQKEKLKKEAAPKAKKAKTAASGSGASRPKSKKD